MKYIVQKLLFLILLLLSLFIQIILLPPIFLVLFCKGKDISGILIKPYLYLLHKIPETWFYDEDYCFIMGFPKNYKN